MVSVVGFAQEGNFFSDERHLANVTFVTVQGDPIPFAIGETVDFVVLVITEGIATNVTTEVFRMP